MSKRVEAFKCEYCHRVFGRMVDAINHENACNRNPARKHCITCEHGKRYPPYDPNKPALEQQEAGMSYCEIHNISIYEKPYFIECETQEQYHGPDRPMPGTCYYYEAAKGESHE